MVIVAAVTGLKKKEKLPEAVVIIMPSILNGKFVVAVALGKFVPIDVPVVIKLVPVEAIAVRLVFTNGVCEKAVMAGKVILAASPDVATEV